MEDKRYSFKLYFSENDFELKSNLTSVEVKLLVFFKEILNRDFSNVELVSYSDKELKLNFTKETSGDWPNTNRKFEVFLLKEDNILENVTDNFK